MQDAGGDHVEEHVRAFDDEEVHHHSEAPSSHIQNDEVHLDPSRWWFASSAFPLIAGTLGPVANAFSICALVCPWRMKYQAGVTDLSKAEFINDPAWLLIVNAIQLVMAVVANMILLLNMAKRIRFTIAQPVTIVAWYISSLCLIALESTAVGPLKKAPEGPYQYIWSQAAYYGIYAACLYFVCSSLMVITFWGAQKGHYDKDFQLTPSQRTLMLQTILFLMYLLIGALVFSRLEGWQYLDAVYWADVTLFTVGFGDFAAQTPLGRALLFPFALVGVISLGLVIGSIRSMVIERGRRKLDARMVEKKRRRIVRRMTRRGKDDILVPITDSESSKSENPGDMAGLTELERREKEFDLMRSIQEQAEHRRRWVAMAGSTGTMLVLWLVGAAIFENCERPYQGWTYFDGFYFAFVGLTTIGYGDVTPISPAGKSFFVFWSLLALPTMTVLISNAGDTVVKFVRDATNQVGNITILPGEQGFSKDFKRIMQALHLARLFPEDENVKESPPGFVGDAEDHGTGDDDDVIDLDGNQHGEKNTDRLDDEIQGITGTIPHTVGDKHGKQGEKPAKTVEGKNSFKRSPPPPPQTMPGRGSPTTPNAPLATRQTPPSKRSTTPLSANSHLSFKEPKQRPSSSQKSGDHDQDINHNTLRMRHAASIPRSDIPLEIPTNRADYQVVLIDEICRVTQHLKSHPPRKYTFQEWAWYLKLIGEDESSANTHRKALPHSHKKAKGASTEDGSKSPALDRDNEKNEANGGHLSKLKTSGSSKADQEAAIVDERDSLAWSWVGSKSPLMGSQEEAEWILEKLQQTLAVDLRAGRSAI